jgi:Glycosyl transferases group 1
MPPNGLPPLSPLSWADDANRHSLTGQTMTGSEFQPAIDDDWQGLPTVLYLTFDVGFLNPTRELLCDILRNIADVTFYGPGYLPLDALSKGIAAYVAANGPYDFILSDETAIEDFSILDRGQDLRFRNHACRFDPALLAMGRDYQNFLRGYDGTRLVVLLQSDYYNFSKQRIETLESISDFYVTWGAEFIDTIAGLDPASMLEGGVNLLAFGHCNDRYLEFLKRHPEKIISCPQFISEAEIDGTLLAARRFDWSVLGADYDARVLAREALDEAGLTRSGDWIRYILGAAQKLNVNLYNKYGTIKLLQWAFRRALQQSKFSFTCGSFVNWPIRKYYEIPANGCVLVCERSNGFGELGFVDKEHAVVCDGADVLDAHAWLTANMDRAQAIADAGRHLVRERHSVAARGRQIAAALQRIRRGNFAGSRWRDGVFELLES